MEIAGLGLKGLFRFPVLFSIFQSTTQVKMLNLLNFSLVFCIPVVQCQEHKNVEHGPMVYIVAPMQKNMSLPMLRMESKEMQRTNIPFPQEATLAEYLVHHEESASFPSIKKSSITSANNHRYVRSYPDLNIALEGNTLLTLVNFKAALEFSTVAETGFSVGIQVSNYSHCTNPELFFLTNEQGLRPMPGNWTDASYNEFSASISRVDMESFAQGRIGVRIPPSKPGCVYTLSSLKTHWTLTQASKELGWDVLPVFMDQMPMIVKEEDSGAWEIPSYELKEYILLTRDSLKSESNKFLLAYADGNGCFAPDIIALNTDMEIVPTPPVTKSIFTGRDILTFVWEQKDIRTVILRIASPYQTLCSNVKFSYATTP